MSTYYAFTDNTALEVNVDTSSCYRCKANAIATFIIHVRRIKDQKQLINEHYCKLCIDFLLSEYETRNKIEASVEESKATSTCEKDASKKKRKPSEEEKEITALQLAIMCRPIKSEEESKNKFPLIQHTVTQLKLQIREFAALKNLFHIKSGSNNILLLHWIVSLNTILMEQRNWKHP